MVAAFRLFGPDHWGALAMTAVIAALLIVFARRLRGAGRFLALIILGTELVDPIVSAATGRLSWQQGLPLELCDLAAFATAYALWTRGQAAFELAWFWGLAGTLQALLTPTVAYGFPHPEYFRFFVLHAGIVIGVLYLGPGLGLAPRRGAVWRVYGWTAIYAACVALVDWALSANYFYLCRKPEGSILEHLGPWPWYIVAGAVIGAALFLLLDLPFRARSSGAGRRERA
jgi:hypothetical integral membrane protein (TIGR02206 family)